MAVKIQTKSATGLTTLAKLGIADESLGKLTEAGTHVMLKANGFQFMKGDENVGFVPVTLEQLQQINNGTLPGQAHATLQLKLMSVIDLVAEGIVGDGTHVTVTDTAKKEKGALDMLPVEKMAAKPNVTVKVKQDEAPKSSGGWPTYPIDKLKTGSAVHLRDAKKMYQPVNGTSSRYYLIGGNEDLRVAARFVGTKLSIRIEGPGIAKHMAKLTLVGLNPSITSTGHSYASIHLGVDSDLMANKALGAVLLGLGVHLETQYPDLKLIKGA